jgi:hypothetical protein
VVAPGLDRLLVDVEFLPDLMEGQQARFAQSLVAALEIVLAPDLLDHGAVERLSAA